jgi:hypothetical protein
LAIGGNTARNALPSESLGNAAATTLLVWSWAWIRSHIGMKALTRCSAPRKYITTYLGLRVGFSGLPPRLMYQGSHGMFEQISGVPSDSAWLDTALTVSGVDDASNRFTPSFRMAVLARSPARVGLDWVS